MRFYLDTCALNRPWDDQSQVRVHIEAESVLHLISLAEQGREELVTSDFVIGEIVMTANPLRRRGLTMQLSHAAVSVPNSEEIAARSEVFAIHGITGYDALHLAAAEAAGCDYFFTTDDRLLKRAQRAGAAIKVKVLNPADWPLESPKP